MSTALTRKITIQHLREARQNGARVPMLTCYDFSMAKLMQEAGVPALLVGDSAASVILGHPTTLPVSLEFLIEITAAVRRGAPLAFLVADMPFGSYQASVEQGVRTVCEMVRRTGCDCVKLEVAAGHLPLVRSLADAGVPVMAHLGLRPQTVAMLGGYRFQGRTGEEAEQIVLLAQQMQESGVVAILLEAVPPEVSDAVVRRTSVPIIGCGAGPACHGHVVVTHDALGLTGTRPKFVPELANIAEPLRQAFAAYIREVTGGAYPSPEQTYNMSAVEQAKLRRFLDKPSETELAEKEH